MLNSKQTNTNYPTYMPSKVRTLVTLTFEDPSKQRLFLSQVFMELQVLDLVPVVFRDQAALSFFHLFCIPNLFPSDLGQFLDISLHDSFNINLKRRIGDSE